MNETNTALAVDWRIWGKMKDVELWKMCLISIGVDPQKVEMHKGGWMHGPENGPFPKLSEVDAAEYNARLMLLKNNLSDRVHFSPGQLNFENPNFRRVRPSEFAAWALTIPLDIPASLAQLAQLPVIVADEKTLAKPMARPYHSEKLTALIQASEKYWARADKSDKTTHPKNEDAIHWLVKNGYTESLARSAATIIRPDWASTGRPPSEE